MKPVIIHPRAARDAREIAEKYAEVSQSLCDRLWAEVDDVIDTIELHPERHQLDSSGMRRSNLKKFAYHILFEERLECDRIIVIHDTDSGGNNPG